MDVKTSKSIAIHQPNYIPWLGYFYKIYQADYFVFLDDAQFSNEGMHNYHYIKTNNGPQRIKIPVFQTLGDRINEVRIRNQIDWREKHLNLLKANYNYAKHFDEIYSDFSSLLNEQHEFLFNLNISIIRFFCKRLGIATELFKSSDLNICGKSEAKIIDICSAMGCDLYYSGIGARAYQKEDHFIDKGIKLQYSDFKPVQYKQQYNGFQSNVTILDFLMNCGYDWGMVIEHQRTA